jgi:hypothetical protein
MQVDGNEQVEVGGSQRRSSIQVGGEEIDLAQKKSQDLILASLRMHEIPTPDKGKRIVFQMGMDNPVAIDMQKLLYREVVNNKPGVSVISTLEKVRLIFLDVDGVLNSLSNRKVALLPDKLRLIGRICAEAGAQIVLSTTWREHPDRRDELLQALVDVAGVAPQIFLGQTPSSLVSSLSIPSADGKPPERQFVSRASQVQAFLGLPEVEGKVEGWCILDDMDLVQEAYQGDPAAIAVIRGHFVRTDNMCGVVEEQVAEIVSILSCKEGGLAGSSTYRGGGFCTVA